MKELDLTKLPIGTKLYCTLLGEVEIINTISETKGYPIILRDIDFDIAHLTIDGKIYIDKGECVVFPSKENRDWSNYQIPITDKSLVWAWNNNERFSKSLRFYDAENDSVFHIVDGSRNGTMYDNYELYKGEYTQWAKDALKSLEE